MSRADFARFVSTLNADESLRNELRERLGGSGDKIPAQDLIAFANDHGYGFTLEDANDELSEAQLEGVTGGLTTSSTSLLTLDASKSSFSFTSLQSPFDESLGVVGADPLPR